MPRTLGQVLVEEGHIDSATVAAAETKTRGDQELAALVVEKGWVDAPTVMNARASLLGVTAVEINPYSIDPEVVQILPEDLARRTQSVPLFRVGNDVTLAMVDPTDIVAIDLVRDTTGCDVNPVLATAEDVERAITHYYGVDHLLRDLIREAERTEATAEIKVEDDELSLEEMAGDTSPIVRIVNLIILKAIRDGASDVHLEPDEELLRVRYRVDGRLQADQTLPVSLHAGMVSRIKILADLDLAQKRLPQDGRISLHAEGRRIDLRISSLPTVKGEKIVMRLLDANATRVDLDDLGLAPHILGTWKDLVGQPDGIILVTGPTGSGKTTTLYSSLAEINDLSRNIVTVEDPVEYDFPIINQVQVNVKAGLTFAAALRSILRQDPNVVMVGEIRDRETAGIAIRAALTGHLVISTLHTNDAASAATRLVDMGVEPYLVASALKGVLAQRLVRRTCGKCVQPVSLDPASYPAGVVERMERDGIEAKAGKGCRHCNGTGYKGRVAIHELLVVSDEIERGIVQQLPAAELRTLARREAMTDLFEDGLQKVHAGLTTLDEVVVATRMQEEETPLEEVSPVAGADEDPTPEPDLPLVPLGAPE